ncbi:MAG: hypothetical protein IJK60_11125 [Clostridia bacterium]|nr:hypothetical protein [Clostridia bacterium]
MKLKDLFHLSPKVPAATVEQSDVRAVNDEKLPASDMFLETPFWGYSPKDYCSSPEFLMIENTVEQFANKLFNEQSDALIDTTLERFLADIAKQELLNIAKQRITHADVIHNLALRRVSLREGYKLKLDELSAEHEQICSEVSKIINESKKNKWRNYNYDELS